MEEAGSDRTMEVAWDAYRTAHVPDMCCNILKDFGSLDRILLVVVYLRATVYRQSLLSRLIGETYSMVCQRFENLC